MPVSDDVVCIHLIHKPLIDCSISTDNPEATLTRPSDQQPEEENDLMENGDENTFTEFSVEQEERFRERFEEGYDLIDPEHLRWLEINHPDSIPADRHMLVLAPESSADVSEDNPTLTDVLDSPLCSHHHQFLQLNVPHPPTLPPLTLLPSMHRQLQNQVLLILLMDQLQSQLKLFPLLSPPLVHQLQSHLKLLPLLSPPLVHQLRSPLRLLISLPLSVHAPRHP